MTEIAKFPSIEQFRHVVRAERETAAFHNRLPAVRTYIGSVKLHGTNAGIHIAPDGEVSFLSRTRIITPSDDNSGFATHMSQFVDQFVAMAGSEPLTLFGEWCGAGIQRSVAICAEQKLFVVFAARVGEEWIDPIDIKRLPDARIFNIRDFPTWEMQIDFSSPEQSQNALIELTEAVEVQCPVAAAFGHEGIGEGIVWMPKSGDMDSRYWFKVKGEKHSSSKVKVLAAVDVERFAARDELVAALVTESRLQQGLTLHVEEFARPLEMSAIGEYLRWVFADVAKEESDTIEASGFTVKELGKPISDVAKRFYIAAVSAV